MKRVLSLTMVALFGLTGCSSGSPKTSSVPVTTAAPGTAAPGTPPWGTRPLPSSGVPVVRRTSTGKYVADLDPSSSLVDQICKDPTKSADLGRQLAKLGAPSGPLQAVEFSLATADTMSWCTVSVP